MIYTTLDSVSLGGRVEMDWWSVKAAVAFTGLNWNSIVWN